MTLRPNPRPSYALIAALFVLSACGKNMHVTWKDNGKSVPKNEAPSSIDTTASKGEVENKVETKVETVAQQLKTDRALLDGSLHAYSKFDLSELVAKRPFMNDGVDANHAIRVIKEPAYLDQESKAGFVMNSNLVFRSIHALPSKDQIKEVTRFELELKGLRLYRKDGASLKESTLDEQVLCIADRSICSGQTSSAEADQKNLNPAFWVSGKEILNDEFSKVKLPVFLNYKEQGAVFEGGTSIVLDLKKLFGLEKLSTGELVDWILANSTEYAPGYRKFRFAMGNHLFLEEGRLNLQITLVDGATVSAEAPTTLSHGSDDAVLSSSKVPAQEVGSVAEETQVSTQTSSNDDLHQDQDKRASSIATVNESELHLALDTVHLNFIGRSVIQKEGKEKLMKTAQLLTENYAAIAKIKVLGRADKVGQEAFNLALSKQRATAVATVLVKGGVPNDKPTSKFVVKGLGEPEKSSCHPKQPCLQDRRVDIEIQLRDDLSSTEKSATIKALREGLAQIWK